MQEIQLLLGLDLSAFSFVFSTQKVTLSEKDQVRLSHWRTFHFFAFKNSWVALTACLGWLSTGKCCQTRFVALGWMWTESTDLYTSEITVTSLINTIVAIHPHFQVKTGTNHKIWYNYNQLYDKLHNEYRTIRVKKMWRTFSSTRNRIVGEKESAAWIIHNRPSLHYHN